MNASTILHVPYRNDAGKLASAFKEAISFIRNQGAVTSAVFFDKKRKWQSNYLPSRIFFIENRPAHETLVLIACASREGSGKSAQMCSFARAFYACSHNVLALMKTWAKI